MVFIGKRSRSTLLMCKFTTRALQQSMSEAARRQAQAEKLTLLVSENSTGYFGVNLANPGQPKPYQARVTRGGKSVSLGCFATAEEAALCVARSPEGQAAAQKATAAPPLTSEEARQQAQAEKLTLRLADNETGYFGVSHRPDQRKPYQARVSRGGKVIHLGFFATAEEAALCVARSPEGKAAAQRAAAVVPPLPSSPPPAPPASARRTAPPPRRWRSCPGSPSCHRASPPSCRA